MQGVLPVVGGDWGSRRCGYCTQHPHFRLTSEADMHRSRADGSGTARARAGARAATAEAEAEAVEAVLGAGIKPIARNLRGGVRGPDWWEFQWGMLLLVLPAHCQRRDEACEAAANGTLPWTGL